MTAVFSDLVYESTTSTGTGSFNLGGARSTDFRTFAAAHTIGDTIFYMCRGGGQWEAGMGTLTGATTLERTTVFDGSAGKGVKVNFAAGTKELYEAPNSGAVIDITALAVASTLNDSAKLLLVETDGTAKVILGSTVKASGTGASTPAPTDTTAPTFPDALSSSNVTQTAFRLSWQAATDTNGIQRYEYSFDGSSWTSAGTALFVDITGRTAGTSYTMRVRAVDPAGNTSTIRQLVVVTQAAAGNQAPAMSGSISVSDITSSGYTFSWPAGTDDVGVDHYETSIDGGTTWTTNGTSLSRVVAGRPASTTDNLRVRAHDAAGLTSNVLSATATTSAAPAGVLTAKFRTTPTTTSTYGGNAYATIPNASGQLDTIIEYNGVKKETGTVRRMWGSSSTVPPTKTSTGQPVTYLDTSPVNNPNDNQACNRIGGTSYPGNWNQASTCYAYGGPTGPKTFYLWHFTDDNGGSAVVTTDSTGNPVAFTVNT